MHAEPRAKRRTPGRRLPRARARFVPTSGRALVPAAVLVLAACGATTTAPATQARTATATATAMPTTPARVVAESSWRVGVAKVDYPDGLAAIAGSVYVKTDDGHVVRLDPATLRTTADVRVDTTTDSSHYCQGIGTDGQTLWACSAAADGTTDVVRLDPRTLEVGATVKVDKVFDQVTLPITRGRMWVLTKSGETLAAVDTVSGHVTTYPVGRRCLQAAATEATVYLTCVLSDEVVAIDATSGRIVQRAHIPGPINVVADEHDVWVSSASGIVRLTRGLQRRAVYPGLVAGREGDLLLTPGTLWVRQGPEFLSRIDTATGAVAARYAIDPVVSGGSLLAVGTQIWTSSFNDNVVLVVDGSS